MTTKPSRCGSIPRLLAIASLLLSFFSSHSFAQSAGKGTISGHVFNPATNEFVANAEVSVQDSNLTTVTSNDGSYKLLNVPAGPVVVRMYYTGALSETATVTVVPDATATQNFELTSTATAAEKDVIKLEAMKVSAQREGNAKSIMDQRASMNVSNIVSAETFGNTAEGNVGDFVKYLPAIQMDNVEADSRSPRVRGLPAQYTTVTMDGMRLASADAFIQNNGTDNSGGAGTADRSFGFEQVSMSSIDAVEVNYTINASQDADAPAGNINLISKHAYERKGHLLSFSASAMANSEELRLSRITRPDDRSHLQILPNFSIDYSDSFFKQRLGVVVSLNESQSFNEQRQFSPTYDQTALPLVITRLQYKDGPKFNERTTLSVTLDFKATEHLSFSLLSIFNNYYAFVGNRSFGVTSTRANVLAGGGDGFTAWNNVAVTSLTSSMAYLLKRTHGNTFIPGFEYKLDRLTLSGKMNISQSTNNYNGGQSKSYPGISVGGTTLSTAGMRVSASRPADDNYAWTIRQTGGLDWGNLANYKAAATAAPTVSVDGRYARNVIYQGKLDAKYDTDWRLPTWLQTGGQVIETAYIYRNPTAVQNWSYVGPGGGNGGSWVLFPSAEAFTPAHGASFSSLSGLTPAVQDHNAIGSLFAGHPEYFRPSFTAANYLTAFVTNPRYIREQTDAFYGMFDTKPLKKLEAQAGLRWERTRDEVKDLNPLGGAEVTAAGFPVTNGQATTIPGINYQYFSRHRAARSHSYNNLYPSGSLKYNITPDLQVLFGYSYTITRPSYDDLSGVTSEDDVNQTITLPNIHLKPEYSDNYTARITYYIEPVSSMGIGFFENDFKNYTQKVNIPGGAAAFGYTDPQFEFYTINTKQNLPGTVQYRGMTLEYNQTLSFLPHPFDGLSVFANYTRTYVEAKLPNPNVNLHSLTPYNYGWLPGISPHVVNYGFNFRYWRVMIGANARWTAPTPYTSTYNEWMKQNTKVDLNMSYSLTGNLSLYFSAKNLFDTPDYTYVGNDNQHITSNGRGIEYYGAYYYAGIKGNF